MAASWLVEVAMGLSLMPPPPPQPLPLLLASQARNRYGLVTLRGWDLRGVAEGVGLRRWVSIIDSLMRR